MQRYSLKSALTRDTREYYRFVAILLSDKYVDLQFVVVNVSCLYSVQYIVDN